MSLAGVFPLAVTLGGALARSAEDVALLMSVLAGADPRDTATLAAPSVDFAGALDEEPSVRGMRIAVLPSTQFQWQVSADVMRARDQAIEALRTLGAEIEEVHVPIDFEDVMTRSGRIIAAEAYALHRDYMKSDLEFDPWVKRRMLGGKGIDRPTRQLAAHRRAAADFAAWMRGRDALLTPTLPITATALDQVDEATTPLASFTRAANYLGACALSLPGGIGGDGLPVAVQLMGAPFSDATLVTIGRAFQQVTDWHRRHPDL